ncbi:MAG TPA: hypothetical protein VHQ70_08345 [Syntrophomonadaceae bacterium]|nr:hypothetical protein [Syntrophomonadaceae bacterium]
MDEITLNEAVENISLIKGVIDRTSKSFSGFSKIFILWGVLFIFNSIITFFAQMNKEMFMDFFSRYPITGYLFPVGIIALLAALIYWKISRKIPLVGLEKHLMTVWMLILVMNVIPNKISVSSASPGIDMKTIAIQTNDFATMLFSLAVGLIITALFTDFKPLMKLGIIYILISIIYAYSNFMTPFDQVVNILCLLALPFTFLFTGFYLKSQQTGGY